MARKSNIKTEGGPSLFDGVEPQETPEKGQGAQDQGHTADDWADLMKLCEETREDFKRAGVWGLFPTETLLRRGQTYYNQRVDTIRETMAENGATPDVITAVCHDYAAVLFGSVKFEATPEQMQKALKALQPYEAFTIDRYALYFALLVNYSRFLLRFHDYTEAVKNENATEETKRAYLSGFYPAMDARAVRWLLNIGYFQPADFAGFDPAEMNAFFTRIAQYSALGEYTLYYTVARLALLATVDEMGEIDPPPFLNTQTSITDFCEQVLRETAENLNAAAEKFAEAFTSATRAKQEQARQAGKNWHDDTNAPPVKIHENYGIVLSQPVNVSPNGSTITKTLPIKRYIDDYNEHPQRYSNVAVKGTVTEQSVQRVIEGANLLPQYLSGAMIRGAGGSLEFHTNLSEFAEICGYVDAGQAEQAALLGALLLLKNLYFVVDKPYKYHEYKDRKGRTRRKQVGGPTAMQFINVPVIGLETGELVIEVYPESLKGRPTLITHRTFKQLQSQNKSTRQSRFNYQIATKSHKSERVLIDKVFGLEDMLKQAETDVERKRVKTYIQNHRAEFRAKMLGWFERYVEMGILTDFTREPSKTDKRDYVLTWHCPDPSKLDPPPFDPQEQEQEPDEQ